MPVEAVGVVVVVLSSDIVVPCGEDLTLHQWAALPAA